MDLSNKELAFTIFLGFLGGVVTVFIIHVVVQVIAVALITIL